MAITEKEKLITTLFENKIKSEEQDYPFTGDALVGYTVHGVKVWREFRGTGEEIVRGPDDTELKGKARNGQLKKLDAELTSGDSNTTVSPD